MQLLEIPLLMALGYRIFTFRSTPALLNNKMGNDYIVKNFDHSGATLLKVGYISYIKTSEFTKEQEFCTNITIIKLDLNDAEPRNWPFYCDEVIPDCNLLFDILWATNPDMDNYICTVMSIFAGHSRFISTSDTWYQQVQQNILRLAVFNQTYLVDLYAAFHDRPDLITDSPTCIQILRELPVLLMRFIITSTEILTAYSFRLLLLAT